jgi:hypothetical protein
MSAEDGGLGVAAGLFLGAVALRALLQRLQRQRLQRQRMQRQRMRLASAPASTNSSTAGAAAAARGSGKHTIDATIDAVSAYDSLIGNTPLILLRKLSAAAGPNILIYAKMECNNPAGTGKDRAVQYMLREVRKRPDFGPNTTIVEGTSGSTGIALAFQCAALGLKCHVVMPDDQVCVIYRRR